MHEILWKCKCDAMHEQIGSFKHNPTQKFYKNLNNFEKPQKLSKTPKTSVRKNEMHSEWEKKDRTRERKQNLG